MNILDTLIKRIKDIDFNKILSDIIDSLDDSIIDRNQNDQLDFGIDALGQRIRTLAAGPGNVYANFTIKERDKKNLQTNNVDLHDTGAFWKTFKVKKVGNDWEVTADFNIHGEDISTNFDSKFDFLGLTPPNLLDFVETEVRPRFEKEVRKQMGL